MHELQGHDTGDVLDGRHAHRHAQKHQQLAARGVDLMGVADIGQHKQDAQAETVQRHVRAHAEARIDPLPLRIGAGDEAPIEQLQHPAQHGPMKNRYANVENRFIYPYPLTSYFLPRSAANTRAWRIGAADVAAPTPPGTGVMASTTADTAVKFRVAHHSVPRRIPAHGHIDHRLARSDVRCRQAPRRTGRRHDDVRSAGDGGQVRRRVWHTVTVAFRASRSMAAGRPTTGERPMTTARFSAQATP